MADPTAVELMTQQSYLVPPSYCVHILHLIQFRRIRNTETRLCLMVFEEPLIINGQPEISMPIFFEIIGQICVMGASVEMDQGRVRCATHITFHMEPRPNEDARQSWIHMQTCLQRIADNLRMGGDTGVDMSSLFPDIQDGDNPNAAPLRLAVHGSHFGFAPDPPGFPYFDAYGNHDNTITDVFSLPPSNVPIRLVFTLEARSTAALPHGVPYYPRVRIQRIAFV